MISIQLGVNCYNELDYNTPFGGFRQSGIGRENGEYALDNYIQVKPLGIRSIFFRGKLTYCMYRSKL
jgi:aldehyde dehydrogenase (NAD+)